MRQMHSSSNIDEEERIAFKYRKQWNLVGYPHI